MPARFGTDGVRGVANEELTAELALALGRATARILPAPTFVVGRDTRRSGPLLQAAFSAGLATEGADVVDLGVLPTPGVATVAAARGGAGGGRSRPRTTRSATTASSCSRCSGRNCPWRWRPRSNASSRRCWRTLAGRRPRPTGLGVGRLSFDGRRRGVAATSRIWWRRWPGGGSTPSRSWWTAPTGRRARFAPARAARRSARRSTALHDAPDGANINDGVRVDRPLGAGAGRGGVGGRPGLAFDGDADRVIAVDHAGDDRRRRRAAGVVRPGPGRRGTSWPATPSP